jgi:large subunit ribosomal protein L29
MANKANEQYKGKSVEELQGAVADLKKELFNLRFQKAAGELTSMGRFRTVRREIARILTAIRQQKNAA